MEEIYLDYAATTPVEPVVVKAMIPLLTDNYGNPSSFHAKGLEAEQAISRARSFFATYLSVKKEEIHFTSGGTESNNMAVLGMARAYKKAGYHHVITTPVEHASVGQAVKALDREGFDIDYVRVDAQGVIDRQHLQELLRPETGLVTFIAVNNEIGTLQPIEEICREVKAYSSAIKIHLDAVQYFGKMPMLNLKELDVDALSVSAHKIGGPKGVGLLYLKKETRMVPLAFGGQHSFGMRPGTENVPGIVGFQKAAEVALDNLESRMAVVSELKRHLIDYLRNSQLEFEVNGPTDERQASPYILNIGFPKIRANILAQALETEGFFVSTGSACQSQKTTASHVVQALNNKYPMGALRISFYPTVTESMLIAFEQALIRQVKLLARYIRR